MTALKSSFERWFSSGELTKEILEVSTGMSKDHFLTLLDAGKIELRVLEQIAKEMRVPVYRLLQFDSREIFDSLPDELNRLKNENSALKKKVIQLEEILIEGGKLIPVKIHE